MIDTTAPTAPTLALGTGVSTGATSAEAIQASGVVTVNAETGSSTVVNYEAKSSYSFTVVATDKAGNAAEKAVTLNVTDRNDNAAVLSSGATGTVAENAATTTVIYTAASTDADGTVPNRWKPWWALLPTKPSLATTVCPQRPTLPIWLPQQAMVTP